jgi:hypothetical protein
MFAVLILLPAVAAVVHYLVVPLPVLRAWGQPARLEVLSQPSGAEVYLDGHRLSALTPRTPRSSAIAQATRCEIRKDGFVLFRRPVRFDQTELLTVDVILQPESRPSFKPMPTAARPAAPRPPPPPPRHSFQGSRASAVGCRRADGKLAARSAARLRRADAAERARGGRRRDGPAQGRGGSGGGGPVGGIGSRGSPAGRWWDRSRPGACAGGGTSCGRSP